MSAEMSNLVKFVFYYGPGTVRTNDYGADLSEFQYTEQNLSAPQTWSLSQLKEWLTGCLGYDREIYTVGVHALWSKSRENVYFTLKHIERSKEWVKWLERCEQRGEIGRASCRERVSSCV